MTLRWLVAALHLVALGIGAGAVLARGVGLQALRTSAGLRWVFLADNLWGIAALLWLVTGLWRAFGGLEKGTAYYLQNGLFHAKMGAFVLILALELWPMVSLVRWRLAARRSGQVDLTRASMFAGISYVQFGLVLLMVFLATAIARGFGG